MLQTIRDRAHGIMAWVILISIAVPFALWGIQNYLDVGKEKPVATVGDKELFERDVNRIAEQELSGLAGLGDLDENIIRRQALERLIQETLLRDEVTRLHMGVGDDDVREVIQTLPYFQTDGKFDKEKYKLAMAGKGVSAAGFAGQMRTAVTMDQLRQAVVSTTIVTPREVDQYLRLKNQRRTVEYLLVGAVKDSEPPSAQAVEDYYRAHEAQFHTPEQVSVQYVELNMEQVAKQVAVGEEDLKNFYEEQKAAYTTPERRKISHILFAVDPDAKDEAALEKAKQAAERLKKGEDFAVLAKELSGDTLSANKGGDLGVIVRGQIDKNLENAAYQLTAAGQVSDPVKTAFGYHLVKLTELAAAKTKSFDEIKDELRRNYQRNAAEKRFYELGEKLSQISFEHSDSLDQAAEASGVKLQETGLFTRDAGDGIAGESAVRAAAFNQEVLDGRNSEVVELGAGRVVVLRVKDHVQAAPQPLEQVRKIIEAQLRRESAETAAKAQAKALFDAFQQGGSLGDVAKSKNLTVVTPKPFGRDDAELPQDLLIAAFRIARPAEGQTGKQLVALASGEQAIIHLLKVEDGDPSAVDAKEKERIREQLARSKGQTEYAGFIGQLRADGDVTVQAAKE